MPLLLLLLLIHVHHPTWGRRGAQRHSRRSWGSTRARTGCGRRWCIKWSWNGREAASGLQRRCESAGRLFPLSAYRGPLQLRALGAVSCIERHTGLLASYGWPTLTPHAATSLTHMQYTRPLLVLLIHVHRPTGVRPGDGGAAHPGAHLGICTDVLANTHAPAAAPTANTHAPPHRCTTR